MPRKKRALKSGSHQKAKPRKYVSLAKIPLRGDHGTGTTAATIGTEVVPLKNDDGSTPTHLGQRRRVSIIDKMTSLTQRQKQAAVEIRDAFAVVESLSSGAPLKEHVDSSPKPDSVVTAQLHAQSRLARCMMPLLRSERPLVERICWENKPPQGLTPNERRRWYTRFKTAMDRVADHLNY